MRSLASSNNTFLRLLLLESTSLLLIEVFFRVEYIGILFRMDLERIIGGEYREICLQKDDIIPQCRIQTKQARTKVEYMPKAIE